MGTAKDPAVLRRRRPALSPRHDVVDLQPHLRAADPSGGQWPLALPAVPDPHLPLHAGRNRRLPLPLLLDEQFQRGRQHLFVGGARLDVRLASLGLLQERHELTRYGEVHPRLGGRHRLHHGWRPQGQGHPPIEVGTIPSNRLDDRRRRLQRCQERDLGDDRPSRHHRRRKDLRHQLLRLLPGAAEEPGQHLGPVLSGHHLGELAHDRDAELSIPNRPIHLGEAPDQAGAHLPVVRRSPGQADLPVEEDEEARESELPVHGLGVELADGEEEIGERGLLVAGEIGDAEGPFACVHGSTLSRELAPSPDARNRSPLRFSVERSRTPPRPPIAVPARDAAT